MNLDPLIQLGLTLSILSIFGYVLTCWYVIHKSNKRLKYEKAREKLLCVSDSLIERGDFRLKTTRYLEAELKKLRWYQPLQQIVLIRCVDTLRQTAYSDTLNAVNTKYADHLGRIRTNK